MKKQQPNLNQLSYPLLIIIFIFSCQQDDPAPGPNLNTFDGVIASGGTPAPPPESFRNESDLASADTVLYNEENRAEIWTCTNVEVELSENNPDFALFTAGTEVVFPGNLLQGNSLSQATPSIIPLKRGKGTITISTLNGSNPENISEEVEEVNFAEIAVATNRIIGNNNGQLSANTNIEIREINSTEEIGLAMNASYQTLSSKVKGSFDFNSSVSYSSYMVKLTQSFYTMVYNVPEPEEIFDESVTPDQLARYIYDGNPGTYISSVNYGRIFYLLIQSTQSKTEVKAAIDASFDAVLSEGSVEIDESHINSLANKKISGYAYGGDANLANGALLGDLENVQNFIKEGGTINNGAPLSYVVRSLYDPAQVVSTALATKYTITNCENISQGLPVYTDARAAVGAACYVSSNVTGTNALFNLDGINFIGIDRNNGSFIEPSALWQWGTDYSCPFRNEGISAATNVRSDNNPEKVYMFNSTGTKYCSYEVISGKGVFSSPTDLNLFGIDNTMPFDAVGAAMDASVGGRELVCFFNMEGTEYTIYEPATFTTPRSIKDFQIKTSSESLSIPFDQVGAAMRVDLKGQEERTVLAIWDLAGTKYVFFDVDENRFIGPFSM